MFESDGGIEPLFNAVGLDVCQDCGAPYCRECGGHTRWLDDLGRLDEPWPGFECECGWAIELPHVSPEPWANWAFN